MHWHTIGGHDARDRKKKKVQNFPMDKNDPQIMPN